MRTPASISQLETSYLTSTLTCNVHLLGNFCLLAEIKKQIQELLEAKLIKESWSSYSSPVTLAHKKGEGKTRLCSDCRKINAITKRDLEPLPRIDWLLDNVKYCQYFSKWQIFFHARFSLWLPAHTAVNFRYGKIGLCNQLGPLWVVGPSTWLQKCSDRALRRILNKHKINFAINYYYFDDFTIYSDFYAENLAHFKTI